MKKTVFEILEGDSQYKRLSSFINFFIMALILLSAVAILLETVEGIESEFGAQLMIFDTFSVIVFSVEYILRVWSCVSLKKYSRPIKGRIRFMLTPMALIDILAISPFYMAFMITDLRFIRVLRLFRIFRLLKLVRYSKAIQVFLKVLHSAREELVIVSVVGSILVFMASAFMYIAEHHAQPEAFASIPHAMWWAVSTLTTVGYGDVTPVTGLGKLLGGLIAITGIGMFALPAGILGSAFVEEFETRRGVFKKCPHCGKTISDRRKADRRSKER